MYNLPIGTSNHKWNKTNLVTLSSKQGMYDEVVCENCGMKGKRFSLDLVTISGRYSATRVYNCPKAEPTETIKKVQVTICRAVGKAFSNLIPGSVHEVVTPPDGHKNDHTGVWVMGVGEPVKLLRSEYMEAKF